MRLSWFGALDEGAGTQAPNNMAGVFGWWLRQMRSLAPGRTATGMPADALIIAIDRFDDNAGPVAPEGQILLRRGGQEVHQAMLDLSRGFDAEAGSGLAIGLRMPPGMVLARDAVLPAAAARDLAAVISFEMDRLTPFNASDVFFGVSELRREQAWLKLTLLVVPRAPVERLLEMLHRVGLAPSFIESGAGRIPLARRAGRSGQRSGPVLAGICAALALVCLAIPLIQQQAQLNAVNHRLRTLMPVEREIVLLRQRVASLSTGQAITSAAQQTGDALQLLAVLTNALPDGTFLSDLTLSSNGLTLDGQSSNAAHLISVLAAAPGLLNPRFIAPVTRAENGSADLFSIQVSVAK